MSPTEVKFCLEFLRGGFSDYGTPKVVMFLESEVEEFKEFINEKLEELKAIYGKEEAKNLKFDVKATPNPFKA